MTRTEPAEGSDESLRSQLRSASPSTSDMVLSLVLVPDPEYVKATFVGNELYVRQIVQRLLPKANTRANVDVPTSFDVVMATFDVAEPVPPNLTLQRADRSGTVLPR